MLLFDHVLLTQKFYLWDCLKTGTTLASRQSPGTSSTCIIFWKYSTFVAGQTRDRIRRNVLFPAESITPHSTVARRWLRRHTGACVCRKPCRLTAWVYWLTLRQAATCFYIHTYVHIRLLHRMTERICTR